MRISDWSSDVCSSVLLHETFSTARLAELRAAGTPVFVDFTADWSLVCTLNERVAIDTEATQEAFAETGVATLKGAWTRKDPEITSYPTDQARNQKPSYPFYSTVEAPEARPHDTERRYTRSTRWQN